MEVTRHWRLRKQRYNLDGIARTEAVTAGPEVVTLEVERPAEAITAQGTVYSWTRIMDAPADFAVQAPYIMAMVQLDSGRMITAQLTDLGGDPEIGQRVEMVTRKLRTDGDAGVIVYGYKFRPILGA